MITQTCCSNCVTNETAERVTFFFFLFFLNVTIYVPSIPNRKRKINLFTIASTTTTTRAFSVQSHCSAYTVAFFLLLLLSFFFTDREKKILEHTIIFANNGKALRKKRKRGERETTTIVDDDEEYELDDQRQCLHYSTCAYIFFSPSFVLLV